VELVWQTIINSLMASAFYAVVAVGLSLAFGVMGIANYAHGEFFMLGAYIVWLLYAVCHWPFFAAVGMAILLVGLLGVIVERAIFRPVRRNVFNGFLISVGLMFILQVFVAKTWGVGVAKAVPSAFSGSLQLFGASVSWQRFIVLPIAVLLLVLLYFSLSRLRLGRGIRACALDSEAATLQGISVNTSSAIALGVAAALAGAAGGLMAPIMAVTPYMGHMVIWTCFVVVIVGGAGNLKGTILAALLFGFLNTIVTTFLDSTIASIASCMFMLILLAIRPQGLLGYAEK
jgi:branched-chain amino acid transport system permease protein